MIKFLPLSWAHCQRNLPFTGTLSVIPFSKKTGKQEYCFADINHYFILVFIFYTGFYTRLTIMTMQVLFKKPLRKALQDTAAVAKNKFE